MDDAGFSGRGVQVIDPSTCTMSQLRAMWSANKPRDDITQESGTGPTFVHNYVDFMKLVWYIIKANRVGHVQTVILRVRVKFYLELSSTLTRPTTHRVVALQSNACPGRDCRRIDCKASLALAISSFKLPPKLVVNVFWAQDLVSSSSSSNVSRPAKTSTIFLEEVQISQILYPSHFPANGGRNPQW